MPPQDERADVTRIAPVGRERMRVVLRGSTVWDVDEVRIGRSWAAFTKSGQRYDVPVTSIEAIVRSSAESERTGEQKAGGHYGQHNLCVVCEAIGRDPA